MGFINSFFEYGCMKKSVCVKIAPEIGDIYDSLQEEGKKSKDARIIFEGISHKIEILKQNMYYGDAIAKKLIPREYKIKYNVNNLFRVELPLFWRMLYTLTNDEDVIIVFIIDILDHKKYNKKFGYRSH